MCNSEGFSDHSSGADLITVVLTDGAEFQTELLGHSAEGPTVKYLCPCQGPIWLQSRVAQFEDFWSKFQIGSKVVLEASDRY